jgi:PAS domain S-box-containing protein
LFEQAPQAVALMNADNRVVRVNREFSRIFGYSPQETLGHALSDLIVPAELQEEDQRYRGLLIRGRGVDAVSIRMRKDASRLHVSMVHVPVSVPGGQIAVYAIYRDITEEKHAQDRLKATSEQLRALSMRLQFAIEQERTRIAREIHDELGSALTVLGWTSRSWTKYSRNRDLNRQLLRSGKS